MPIAAGSFMIWRGGYLAMMVAVVFLALATSCPVTIVARASDDGQHATEMQTKGKWLDEHLSVGTLDSSETASAAAPFAFVYDGRPSAELLARWKRKVETKKLDGARTERTTTWTDPKTGLEVRCTAIDYGDFPAVEWLLRFTNTGTGDSPIIASIRPLSVRLPGGGKDFVVRGALGDRNSAESFAPVRETMAAGDSPERVFASVGGKSSQGYMPYFNVDWHGGGVVFAIGWSGQWEAGFQSAPDGGLQVRAGQQLTHFKLHPGETMRSPRIVLAFWDGDDDLRGNNVFRGLALAHYYPRRDGKPVFPPLCASVGYTAPGGSYEKPHLDAIEFLKGRGIEVFWSDMDPQQWYPGGFPTGTGTWEVDRTKYPNGLKPIGDAVQAAGMQYLLWFEPERVHPGTKIDKEHPEWVMRAAGEGSQLFRLHDPAARKWITDCIDRFVTEAQLGWIRWDFNIDPLGFWRRNDAPDRQGITEIRHIEGLYAMWEDLERRHPGLLIDNCAGGGRRLDIETFRYGLPLWHSDLQCSGQPETTADQLQNAGLYRWIPMHGCGEADLEPSYGFRSAMTPGNILPIGRRPESAVLSPEKETAIAKTIAIYHKLRPFTLGDFYPLFPHVADETAWYGYQFHRSHGDDGFAMLFRREKSADASRRIGLRGVDPQATYEVSFEDTTEKREVEGFELARLEVHIPAPPGSAIVYYCRVAKPK
jgi:alpha-galactosidase